MVSIFKTCQTSRTVKLGQFDAILRVQWQPSPFPPSLALPGLPPSSGSHSILNLPFSPPPLFLPLFLLFHHISLCDSYDRRRRRPSPLLPLRSSRVARSRCPRRTATENERTNGRTTYRCSHCIPGCCLARRSTTYLQGCVNFFNGQGLEKILNQIQKIQILS